MHYHGLSMDSPRTETTLPRDVHRRYDSALKCLAERDTQTEPDTCSDRHINPIRGVRVDLGRPQSNYYQDTCMMIHPEQQGRVAVSDTPATTVSVINRLAAIRNFS